MYFLKDTKQEGNKVRSITSTPTVTTEILFENGNKYTYDGTENLYFNKVLICSNITSFKITEDLEEDYGKTVLKVEMTIGESVYSSNRYEKTTEYVMTTKSNISPIPVGDSYIDNTKGYTVTFDPNGGNMLAYSKTLNIGEIYGNMPISAKDSSTFAGWYTAKEAGTKVEESTTMDRAEDHTLYAHYSIEVTFIKVGTYGEITPFTTKKVITGQPYGELPTIPKGTSDNGVYWYTYCGIYSSNIDATGWTNDNNTPIFATSIVPLDATNHTLTAREQTGFTGWIPQGYAGGYIRNIGALWGYRD